MEFGAQPGPGSAPQENRGPSHLSSGSVSRRPAHVVFDIFVRDLLTDLLQASSGIEFIYNTLDQFTKYEEVRDAAVVVDDALVGRQVFRAGRRSPTANTVAFDPLEAPQGLYTEVGPTSTIVSEIITSLCLVALHLDFSHHDASHDSLTGLFNRRSFDAMLDESATRSSRYEWRFVLALVDIDRFKTLNDQLGHSVGDRILQTTGAELRNCLRGGDVAARVGGDEFALILHNSDAGALPGIIHRLRQAVAASVGVEVGFSAGTAAAPEETVHADSLFQLADKRLYQAKRQLGASGPP